MQILEEFWYGNLEPNGVDIIKGSEFDKLLRLLC